MKLELNENTLNAYITRAITEEINELVANPESNPQGTQSEPQTGLDPNNPPFAGNRTETGKFQTWFNKSTEDGGMGGNLVVDGICGKNTRAAWQQWLQTRDL